LRFDWPERCCDAIISLSIVHICYGPYLESGGFGEKR
jgi:hypothetical protein